jgi:4-amino-4-deoxy-L-arabinose transferase-like glycosyltransferase
LFGALLLAFLLAQLRALPLAAPTVDEQAHLARGLAIWRAGDLRLYVGHPPLVHILAALPVAVDPRVRFPLDDPTWLSRDWIEFPITLFWKMDNPAPAMFSTARMMIVLLSALLLAALYRLGAEVGGRRAGLAVVALAALDPNLRAHARLITTDLGVLLALTLTVLVWRRWLRAPAQTGLAIAAGGMLGLALVSKYTAALFVPALLIVTWVRPDRRALSGTHQRVTPSRPPVRSLILALAATGLTAWAIYGFELRPALGFSLPIPLASYWEEFLWTTETLRFPSYLLGRVSESHWLYFPVALLVKTPLPLLMLAVFGAPRLRTEPLLWLPAAFYFAVAIVSGVNIGYRHLFPLLPTLYVAAALPLARWWGACDRRRLLAAGAVGWLLLNSALVYPRDLTFFNELALGPDNGWRVLVDSNLDWGQDLGELVNFVRERGIGSIYVSYFGSIPIGSFYVEEYPLPARPLPPRPASDWQPLFPQPGWYAISLTHLLGGAGLPNPDTFAYFRHQQPEAVLGRTIYIYRVPEETGTVAVCINPPPSVGEPEARRIFGAAATRLIQFDCARGLLLPAGRAWYLLRGEQADNVREPLEKLGATLQYDEPNNPDPRFTFRLYRLENAAAQAATYPAQPIAPQVFGERLAFLGHRYRAALKPGEPAEVQTAWRVVAPLTEPLSLFLHLSAPDGFPLAVSDGLNTPFDSLRPGDTLIQFHPLEVPKPLPAGAHFRAGAYALGGAQPRYLLPDGADFVAWEP